MAEPFSGYNQLDDAISQALAKDDDTPEGSVIVGWVVCVAYKSPAQLESGSDNQATHAYFKTDGMAPYAAVGLLQVTQDWMRGLPTSADD